MSKIYTNAVIHTEDPKNPQADTVVIGGGVGFSGYPVDTHDGGCRPLLRVKYK